MARQYIEDVAYWAKAYNLACSGIECAIEDEDKDILSYTIRFASGHVVTALSSRPANLRSKKGRIRIDEAAFHNDLEELIKAALAINMWGGKVAIWSTHNGKDNYFNQLIEKCKSKELNYSYHRYDLKAAIADGLYRRICLMSGQKWSIKGEIEWEEQLRKDYGINAREELDCIPFEAKGVGTVFKREWFEVVDYAPRGGQILRFWDLAATVKDTAYFTAGVKLQFVDDVYYVLDAIAEQVSPAEADNLIATTAVRDGNNCSVYWELEGGSAGIRDAAHLQSLLSGFSAEAVKPQGDKVKRAVPFASEAMRGNVKLVRGDWNDQYLNALYKFNGSRQPLVNDLTDASSGAYSCVEKESNLLARAFG